MPFCNTTLMWTYVSQSQHTKQNSLSTLVIPFVYLAQPDEVLIRQYYNYVHTYVPTVTHK